MLLWVDGRVMERARIVLGGGGRDTKIVTVPAIFEHTPNTEIVPGLANRVPVEESAGGG